jgi:hypothetical protein
VGMAKQKAVIRQAEIPEIEKPELLNERVKVRMEITIPGFYSNGEVIEVSKDEATALIGNGTAIKV